jgi:integrase
MNGKAGTKRRGHNEGSVYKRKDGRWVGAMTIEGGKRKEFSGKSRDEVRARLAKALYEREHLGFSVVTGVSAERQTLTQYMTGWLETIKPPVLDEKTWQHHTYLVTHHLLPTLGTTRLTQLSAQQVQALYATKLAEGLSSTTVHHLHASLHRALAAAVRLDLVVRNVSDLVDATRMAESEMHPLSREEARTLLDIASGERLGALYVVALATGMRQSELLGLRWADVDLDAEPVPVVRVQFQQRRDRRRAPRAGRRGGAADPVWQDRRLEAALRHRIGERQGNEGGIGACSSPLRALRDRANPRR